MGVERNGTRSGKTNYKIFQHNGNFQTRHSLIAEVKQVTFSVILDVILLAVSTTELGNPATPASMRP